MKCIISCSSCFLLFMTFVFSRLCALNILPVETSFWNFDALKYYVDHLSSKKQVKIHQSLLLTVKISSNIGNGWTSRVANLRNKLLSSNFSLSNFLKPRKPNQTWIFGRGNDRCRFFISIGYSLQELFQKIFQILSVNTLSWIVFRLEPTILSRTAWAELKSKPKPSWQTSILTLWPDYYTLLLYVLYNGVMLYKGKAVSNEWRGGQLGLGFDFTYT